MIDWEWIIVCYTQLQAKDEESKMKLNKYLAANQLYSMIVVVITPPKTRGKGVIKGCLLDTFS